MLSPQPLRLLCLSDLHGDFDRFPSEHLPDADAVIVAGDITTNGLRYPPYEDEPNARLWFAWMRKRYRQVYYILGNHDLDITPAHFEHNDTDGAIHSLVPPAPSGKQLGSSTSENVFLLHGLRLTGINLSPTFGAPSIAARWANMTARRKEDAAAFAVLPVVDILVSHCPPLGICDTAGPTAHGRENQHLGSPGLRHYVETIGPRLVVCGHVHEAMGVAYVPTASGETCVVNTALTATLVSISASGLVEVEEASSFR